MEKQDNNDLKELLTALRSDSDHCQQEEEYRKKYENYKKIFLNEKLEKDQKIKEIEILKSTEDLSSEAKDLKIKYENMKALQQKEYQARKEKEEKLE